MSVSPTLPRGSGPAFSVVVPTHRRPEQLGRCLGALAALDYPPDGFEVIVVDDGAGMTEGDQAELRARLGGPALTILAQPRSGPATARNRGAAVARGRYLAFTDDDCTPAPDWLHKLEAQLVDEPVALVGGATLNALPTVPYSAASQMLIDYLYEYYHVELTGARFFTTNNIAMRADAFRALGGFDEGFPLAAGEDREFCERWQHSGRRLIFAADALVHHGHRLTLRGFVRQHFNYGRGADFLHRCRARAAGREHRPRLEPLSFYGRLVSYPLGRAPVLWALPLSALLCLSQAAYGAGYLMQRVRNRWMPQPDATSADVPRGAMPGD